MIVNFLSFSLSKTFIFLALFFLSSDAFSQLIPISLEQRIDNANIIFEGKVISKTSFWNEPNTQIYTSNIVSVYKIFKGNLTATQVEIITQGGIVGKDMEEVSHSLQLNIGDIGIFTAIPNPVKFPQKSNLLRFKAYAGLQGFIKYNLNRGTASDPFTSYKSITAEVYPAITRRTKVKYSIIKKTDFKIN